jgi:hypothetical protein
MADTATQSEKTNGSKPLKKMEAVRRALAELGKDAKPIDLQSHIRDKYGIEMGAKHISVCKGKIRMAARKRAARKPAAKQTATATADERPVSNGRRPATAQPAIGLAQQVARLKQVVQTIGKDEAKSIIDLL